MAKRPNAAGEARASEKNSTSGQRSSKQRRSWGARTLRAAWIGLGVAVLAAAIWVAWLLVGTNQLAASQARAALEAYESSCAGTTENDSAKRFEVLGTLSFPGQPGASWPVLGGVSDTDLGTGVGWYPQSAGVGEIGNMVVAGYRVTNGAPFANLLDLNVGDIVQITTCTHVYSYEIVVAPRDLTVAADAGWVLDAVPGQPGQRPTGRMITLITSQDLLPTADRSVGMGQLVAAQPR